MTAAVDPVTRFVVHRGVYKDSLVLMQLQERLLERQGIVEAGAAMASPANLELLAAGGLLPDSLPDLGAEDLLVVVRAETEPQAEAAIEGVLESLGSRRATEADAYRPRSFDGALSLLPHARWALVSVPGQYAGRVARDALDRGLNVFLYSDNVPDGEALELKRAAAQAGLLVLGPDCGTAIVGGVGLGFSNRVRRGAIGLVGGSGTGLQAVSVGIHALGAGVSQAIGTGGRDLSQEIGGITTRQALRVLADDPETRVVVLVSKTPGEGVARRALDWAAACAKPVVVYFQGFTPAAAAPDDAETVHLAADLEDAAAKAVALLGGDLPGHEPEPAESPSSGLLRGLFAGGTLAAEALYALQNRLEPLYSNVGGRMWHRLDDLFTSRGHTILDLGADELTHGRLHPMIDQAERLRRLEQEAADPEVGLVMLDVVLGEGAHLDPAAELAPAIESALRSAASEDRDLRIVVVLVGTEDDPQEIDAQQERLEAAGAVVVTSVRAAVRYAPISRVEEDPTIPMLPRRAHTIGTPPDRGPEPDHAADELQVPTVAFAAPLVAINVGLESFHASLVAQGAEAVHVDWRPPAGGDDHLLGILDRLRGTHDTPGRAARR
jgi:FdrA protein